MSEIYNFVFQIFEMMDAKARLDCMKEIQLLQVSSILAIMLF